MVPSFLTGASVTCFLPSGPGPDKEALSEFLKVRDPVKRYVSVGCSMFHDNGSTALVGAVSRFLSKHELSGVELRAGSQEDLDAAVLILRVRPTHTNTSIEEAALLGLLRRLLEAIKNLLEFKAVVLGSSRHLPIIKFSARVPPE